MSDALTNTTMSVATGIADATDEKFMDYLPILLILVAGLIGIGAIAIAGVYEVFHAIFGAIKEIRDTYKDAIREQSYRRGR